VTDNVGVHRWQQGQRNPLSQQRVSDLAKRLANAPLDDDEALRIVQNPMMRAVRLFLLIVTAIWFAGLNYEGLDYHGGWKGWAWEDVSWVGFFVWVSLLLNLIYFAAVLGKAAVAPKAPKGRLSRLIELWLDAKENELRARAGRPPSPPG
jgi:hypothetical protein